AHLGEHGHREPQQQHGADDPGGVRKVAAEDEQGEQTTGEGGQGDTPAAEPDEAGSHSPRGSRWAMRRGASARRGAARQASTSGGASWARRWAPTTSRAPWRTALSSVQISRSTVAMVGSSRATCRMTSTYSSETTTSVTRRLDPGKLFHPR